MFFLLGFFGIPLLYLALVNLTDGALKGVARDTPPMPPQWGAANRRIPGLEAGHKPL
jgi:hypothetical protein